MSSKRIDRPDITDEVTLSQELVAFSKAHPEKWLTYWVTFGKVRFVLHDRKPSNLNTPGAEFCFREFGGFFKNGKIIEPSKSFITQFNFTPVLG